MKKRRTLLVIDVGHCSGAMGARAPFPPHTTEWDYNLDMAGFIREKLTNTDSRVILQENDPHGYRNLPHRINQMRPDLVISLHCKAAASQSAFGTEMIYLPNYPMGRAFAEQLQFDVCRLWSRGRSRRSWHQTTRQRARTGPPREHHRSLRNLRALLSGQRRESPVRPSVLRGIGGCIRTGCRCLRAGLGSLKFSASNRVPWAIAPCSIGNYSTN